MADIAQTGLSVLLVEDDRRLQGLLERSLGAAGHHVAHGVSAEAGMQLLEAGSFDVIVLDVGLPGMDGFDFCRQLRSRGFAVPVLMLTARGELDARVEGLDAGADDYMIKPFSIREFTARIRALARRGAHGAADVLEVGLLRCNRDERRAWRGDAEFDLSPREFDLLVALMGEPGVALYRHELLERVWAEQSDTSSNVVDQYVRRLRAKVDDPFGVRSIETVRAVGYRIRRDGGVG